MTRCMTAQSNGDDVKLSTLIFFAILNLHGLNLKYTYEP